MSNWCNKCGGLSHEGHGLIEHCSDCGGIKPGSPHIDANRAYRHCFCGIETPHIGVMRVTYESLQHMSPPITMDACSVQRELRDQGVFDRLHTYLLLPETYTIKAMFYARQGDWREWELWVESPDLPEANTGMPDDLPMVDPIYCMVDGTPHLVEIRITPRPKSIPVKGGIDWLFKAVFGNLAKRKDE